MPDPKEMQIKAALETRLALILTASGYHTNAGANVLADPIGIEDIDSTRLPCVYVHTGIEDEPSITIGVVCYTTKTEYIVRGYVKGENPDDEILKLKADIKRAILSESPLTVGGVALGVFYLGGSTDYGHYEHLQRGMVNVAFDVQFQWTPATA